MAAAIRDDNPVVFLDDRWLYRDEATVPKKLWRARRSGPGGRVGIEAGRGAGAPGSARLPRPRQRVAGESVLQALRRYR